MHRDYTGPEQSGPLYDSGTPYPFKAIDSIHMEEVNLTVLRVLGNFATIYLVNGLPPDDYCIIARVQDSVPVSWRVCWYQSGRLLTPGASTLYASPHAALATIQDEIHVQ
jgi:hypothetical protein